MTFAGTPTTPAQLTRYREAHKITVSRDFDEDMGRMVEVCAHDAIRIYPRRLGGYVHDVSTIKSLAALERGEGIAW